jgi:hypothetical protein
MKKVVVAFAFALLCLLAVSPAHARHIYHYSLCTPMQKQTDHDPVTSIVLQRYAQTLDVKFRFASGRTIKRSEQNEIGYRNPNNDPSNPDVWYGKSIKEPNLVMEFKIDQRPGNTSEYSEVIQNLTTGKDTFVTSARCHEVQPHEVGEEDDVPQPGEEGYKVPEENPLKTHDDRVKPLGWVKSENVRCMHDGSCGVFDYCPHFKPDQEECESNIAIRSTPNGKKVGEIGNDTVVIVLDRRPHWVFIGRK